MVTTLYRPVGLREMEAVLESGGWRFPPRRKEQPVFYPVLNADYAAQIAREWNAESERAGYVGFVTRFGVDAGYLSRFDERVVGRSIHRELWIPAEQLEEFNARIREPIRMEQAFYGSMYLGPKPTEGALEGSIPEMQLPILARLLEAGVLSFLREIRINARVVRLNYAYWVRREPVELGIGADEKVMLLMKIQAAWTRLFPGARLLGDD